MAVFGGAVRNVFSITLIAVVLFVIITVEYFATLGPMVFGRIDHLLLSTPCCGTEYSESESESESESKSKSKSRIPTLNQSLQLDRPFDYVLWKIMTQTLTRYQSPSCRSLFGMSSECRQSLDQEYCRICEFYQRYRCHFRAEELLLRRSPWRNQANIRNASVHSNEHCTFPPSRDTTDRRNESSTLTDLLFRDEPTNVLRTTAVDRKDTRGNAYFSTALDPQPAFEVRDLTSNWHSIFRPVIDVNASGVVVHFVVGYGRVGMDGSGGGVAVPMVWLGNSTLEEVTDMIPASSTEEGLYPRLGIVNITDVTLVIYNLIDSGSSFRKGVGDDDDDDRSVPTKEIVIPDEIFLPLLQVTIDAGEEGTDQIVISSMLKEALIMLIRKHVLGEEKLRASFHKTTEITDAIKSAVIDNVRKGSDVVNDHLDRATDRVKGVVQNLEEEWNRAVRDDQNQLWKPLLGGVKERWDEIKRGLQDNDETGAVLMDNVEEEMNKKWKQVKKEATQGWGNMKFKIFDKMTEINDDWKKAQTKVEDSVSPIVSSLGDTLFANND